MSASVFRDYLELTKPRISALALIMAALGYGLASPHGVDGKLAIALVGIALVGAASGALNQYIEREWDARMERTANRPLPAGRLEPKQALVLGIVCMILGEAILLFFVNSVTAVLGALTLFFYLGIYTPSKRVSSFSTLIGAIPGAMPPLLGWTAARGVIGPEGLVLFGILFLWQIPHFLAIAWVYREEYARAEFPILTVVDSEGSSAILQVLVYSLVLLPLSLVPSAQGVTGRVYFYGALLLGLTFLLHGVLLAVKRTKVQARRLFWVSLLYLPALGVLMVWDKV